MIWDFKIVIVLVFFTDLTCGEDFHFLSFIIPTISGEWRQIFPKNIEPKKERTLAKDTLLGTLDELKKVCKYE